MYDLLFIFPVTTWHNITSFSLKDMEAFVLGNQYHG